ncbi:MAG: CoA transferase [Planctomycetes bacterium]|nr:CoA transferase [Planctomycetota bacterium]
MPSEPLSGIRVLDLTRVLAGPFCTMLLADLGAEVVKIERPGGDDARQFGPFLPSGESAYFAGINRGKKSVILDLKDEADRETFRKLVVKADVVVENYRPGTMEAFGLGTEQLRAINPRLVYASVSGFGRTGPYRRRPAYDIIVQALGGLMSITGHDKDEPARVGSSISDILAGMYTALSIVASLSRRGRTGDGADIDLAMLDCTVAVLENAISRYAITGQVPRPLGTRHPSITPFQAFRAADGSLVIAAGNDALWQKLCEVLGTPELVKDPLLATNALRTIHQHHMEQAVQAALAKQSVEVWLANLLEAGIPAAPIQDIAQVLDDPQLEARSMWHTLIDRDGVTLMTPGSPLVLDGKKPDLENTWPRLGENQDDVLREWLGQS